MPWLTWFCESFPTNLPLVMRVTRERLTAGGTLVTVAAAAGVIAWLADAVERAWEYPAVVRELDGQVNALNEHAGCCAPLRRSAMRSDRLWAMECEVKMKHAPGAYIV